MECAYIEMSNLPKNKIDRIIIRYSLGPHDFESNYLPWIEIRF